MNKMQKNTIDAARRPESAPAVGSSASTPRPESAPLTLREYWAELNRAKAAPAAAVLSSSALSSPGRPASPDCPAPAGSFTPAPHPASSGSGGTSGSSGGSGYGIGLIAAEPDSQERIMRIMRMLCEKDAQRKKASDPPAQ